MTRRTALSCCAAVLALASVSTPAVAVTPAAYPAAAVLGAVRDACSELSTRKTAASNVAAAGWTKAPDPFATPVGALVRFGYDEGRKLLKDKAGRIDEGPLVFSHTVGGETLYLVLSSVEMDGMVVNGCRAYDVGESRRIGKDEATSWAGRAPDASVDRPELVKYTWEPGLVAGQDSFEVFYVPAGSPLVAMTKLPGIAIKADLVGVVSR